MQIEQSPTTPSLSILQARERRAWDRLQAAHQTRDTRLQKRMQDRWTKARAELVGVEG